MLLPEAVHARERLLFDSRVPPRVEEEDARRTRQVEAHITRAQREEQHAHGGIVFEAFELALLVNNRQKNDGGDEWAKCGVANGQNGV